MLNSTYVRMYVKSLNWPSMAVFSPFGQKVFTDLNTVKFASDLEAVAHKFANHTIITTSRVTVQ